MPNNSESNRARNFEITRAITPWIVLHSVQLLLLIMMMTIIILITIIITIITIEL